MNLSISQMRQIRRQKEKLTAIERLLQALEPYKRQDEQRKGVNTK